MEEQSQTKEQLLNAARDLMLEKGFVATSVDEICAKAKVTKGSFFYYFKTKDDLGKDLVQRFTMQMGARFMEKVKRCGEDPRARVFGWIDAAMAMGCDCESKGCLIGTFTQELSESHPEIRGCCEDAFRTVQKMFMADLAAARKKYSPKADIDMKGLAETFAAVAQGSMILIKATRDHSLMKRTLQHFKNYLEHLLGR